MSFVTLFLYFLLSRASAANIKLGILLPISPGDTGTTFGNEWTTTALVAAQTINNESFIPGYNIELIVHDTLDTPTGTVMAAFQCAAVDHCLGVVGAAYSQYSELVQYVLQNYSIPQISPVSTSIELSDKTQYPTFLRTIPADTAAGPAIARVITHFNWSQVGLIVGSDSYSNSLYKAFSSAAKDQNIKVVVETFLETIQPNYETHVADLKNAYTQIFVIFSQQLEAEKIFQEAYTQGIFGPQFVWIGGDTLSALNMSAFPNGELKGNLVIAPSAVANTTLAKQYQKQMLQLNISVPYASFVYDAVYTYAHAFRELLTANASMEDPRALLSTLLSTDFMGVTGEVQFDENGDRVSFAFDILNWDASDELQLVGRIDALGQFIPLAPIIWADNSSKVPLDYLYLLRHPPPERVKVIYTILASVLLASVGFLILVLIGTFVTKKLHIYQDNLLVNLTNTAGGVLGCAAVILIVSGVSEANCIIAPVLMDLSLLICGGVITLSTLHDFIDEYGDNTEHWLSVKATKRVLYCIWGLIMLLNLAVLTASFAYEKPAIILFFLEQNFYENQCNFGQHVVFLLPATVGMIFAFAVVATFMKIFVNTGVAKYEIVRTRKADLFNGLLHTATIVVLIIGAVVIAVITPTQTQLDIIMCTIILVANLSVPFNLGVWYYRMTKPRRDSYLKETATPLPPRQQPNIPHSFTFSGNTEDGRTHGNINADDNLNE